MSLRPELSYEDLEAIFTYHPPLTDQVPRYERIREAGKVFAQIIMDNSPASMEQTIAIARIQEAVMWANAAIARE